MSCKRTGRRPPEKLRLTLDSLAYGGDAVGRSDEGEVVFVPGGAPGDRVEVDVLEAKKSWARGQLVRLLAPGPGRREAPCPLFRPTEEDGCGGCQWQHVDEPTQRAAKEEIVRRALRHTGAEVSPILAPAPAFGWRRRVRLRWRRVAGGTIIGLGARRSHRLVDVPACPQLEPALDEALAHVRVVLGPLLDGAGELHMLAGDGVHVVVEGRAPIAGAAALVGRGGIVGVEVRAGAQVERFGATAVAVDGGEAGADDFAQASRAGNDALREVVRAALGPTAGKRVLELYAGSGNFTRDLAGAQVVAADAASDAPALPGVTWRIEPVETTLAALAGERFDLLLLDPPRTGAEILAEAASLATARIVYVSCDPPTLARDLAKLPGWRVTAIQPLDLMPQTFHVEVVVTLVPASPSPPP